MKEKIEVIEKRYGDYVFSCALMQLVYCGAQKLKKLDVDAEIKNIWEHTEDHDIMSPEMQIDILRCSVELSHYGPRDILSYVQRSGLLNNNTTNHPGKIVQFMRENGREVCTVILPAGTDAETMDELQTCLDASSPEAENVSSAQYVTNCIEKGIGMTGWKSRFEPDETIYF